MNYKNRLWNIFKYFSNLTISIILLLMIATLSIIGTIIEQDHSIEFYQNKYPIHPNKLFDFNWQIIQNYQLDQLYTNFFFLAILFLFGLSLIICTFSTQLPSLKNAKRWKFKKIIPSSKELYKQKFSTFKTPSKIIYFLNDAHYYTFYQKNYIYAYKGLSGRLAPVFVHLGLILLLAGTSISLFTSFSLQAMIPIGETFNLQNIVKAGVLSKIPADLIGKVHDFHIEYYDNQSIKQFYSVISMMNKRHHNQQQLLYVNKPLHFEGLTIYQTDWELSSLRIEINNQQIIQIPLIKLINNNKTYWIGTFTIEQNNMISLLVSNLNDPLLCYDQEGNLIKDLPIGKTQILNHVPIKIIKVLASTGLQIKEDPGVSTIYIGFAILMVATLISYTSYSQIWIIIENNAIQISGLTNRAEIQFEEDIFKFKKALIQ